MQVKFSFDNPSILWFDNFFRKATPGIYNLLKKKYFLQLRWQKFLYSHMIIWSREWWYGN